MINNRILQILKSLLLAFCVFWIVMAIIYLLRIYTFDLQHLIIMILMIFDAICFAVFAFLINRKSIVIYIMLILFILINAVLTVTDQLGIIDWLTLLFNIVVLVLSILITIALFRKK